MLRREIKDKPRRRWSWARGPRAPTQWRLRRAAAAFAAMFVVYRVLQWMFGPSSSTALASPGDVGQALSSVFTRMANPALPVKLERSMSRLLQFRYSTQKSTLFVFKDLGRSSQLLLSTACALAGANNVNVHVLLVGTTDIDSGFFLSAQGVTQEECPVTLHDGRIEPLSLYEELLGYSEGAGPEVAAIEGIESTYFAQRLRKTIAFALRCAKPTVVVYASADDGTTWYDSVMREHDHNHFIEVLPHLSETVGWMDILDSSSLAAVPKVELDIVIPVTGDNGALQRLLRSISNAVLFTEHQPRLILNLDQSCNQDTLAIIRNMNWSRNKIVINYGFDQTMHSVSHAWHPPNDDTFGLIIDDISAELSPIFYIYCFAMILRLKYSDMATRPSSSPVSRSIMGFSLLRSAAAGKPEMFVQYGGPEAPGLAVFAPRHYSEYQAFVHRSVQGRTVSPDAWRQVDQVLLNEFMSLRPYGIVQPPMFPLGENLAIYHHEKHGLHTDPLDNNEDDSNRIGREEALLQDAKIFTSVEFRETIPALREISLLDAQGELVTYPAVLLGSQEKHKARSSCPQNLADHDPYDLFCPLQEAKPDFQVV